MELLENDGVTQNACKGRAAPGKRLIFGLRQAEGRKRGLGLFPLIVRDLVPAYAPSELGCRGLWMVHHG